MYYYALTFKPLRELGREKNMFASKISWFLFLCRLSGQILGRPVRRMDQPFSYYIRTTEVDSFDEKNDPAYLEKFRTELKGNFEYCLTLLDSGEGECVCEGRKGIEMRMEDGQIESPFICLSCGRSIPLYKLPAFEDGSFEDTISWQDAFTAMLDLNATVFYDAFSSDELLRYDSKLNKEGRRLAKLLAERVDVPVYYRLYEIDETFKLQPRQRVEGNYVRICPVCGKTMCRIPVGEDEVIEVCEECKLSSAEEVVEW